MMSRRTLLVFWILAGASGVLVLGQDHDDILLSDGMLARISGLDDNRQSISIKQACEEAAISAYGGYRSDNCPPQDGLTCWICPGAAGKVTPIPNTSGGPGIKPAGANFNCGAMIGWVGKCMSGMCAQYNPAFCPGTPAMYDSQ